MPKEDTRPAPSSATLDDAIELIGCLRDVCYRAGDHDSGKRWEHALDALESAMSGDDSDAPECAYLGDKMKRLVAQPVLFESYPVCCCNGLDCGRGLS